jgi:stage V sporulation protein G
MEITEVRVKLIDNKDERLKAFCSMTIDNDFVVRDIKVIMGTNGYFVAMPSRKMSDHCPKCGGKNHLRARFCNNCGASLNEDRAKKDMKGRMKLHADMAHPINAQCRQAIQDKIVKAFEEELEKSKLPGYKPLEFDEPDDDVPEDAAEHS